MSILTLYIIMLWCLNSLMTFIISSSIIIIIFLMLHFLLYFILLYLDKIAKFYLFEVLVLFPRCEIKSRDFA